MNIHVFNKIRGINESKILTKDILCECKGKFDGRNIIKIKSGITINVDVSVKSNLRGKN